MRETQLLVSYPGSPVVRDERATAAGFAAGDRALDAGQLRRPFVGYPLRLHERLERDRHVLFGLVADEAAVNTLFDMMRL
jgi:hypothetical protein